MAESRSTCKYLHSISWLACCTVTSPFLSHKCVLFLNNSHHMMACSLSIFTSHSCGLPRETCLPSPSLGIRGSTQNCQKNWGTKQCYDLRQCVIAQACTCYTCTEKKTVQCSRLPCRLLVQVSEKCYSFPTIKTTSLVMTDHCTMYMYRHNPNHSGREQVSFEEIPFVKEEWAKKSVHTELCKLLVSDMVE